MRTKAPSFQFYPDDFLGGTIHFTDAEVGLYVRLLSIQWNSGFIPDDLDWISTVRKGSTPIDRVKSKFKKGRDGHLRNHRLEQERRKQNAFRESRKINGSKGGRPPKPSANLPVLKTEPTESSSTSLLLTSSPTSKERKFKALGDKLRSGDLETQPEPDQVRAFIGEEAWGNDHRKWFNRARRELAKLRRVLGEAKAKAMEGFEPHKNWAAYLEDLWKRFK